jgi:hypothetical protein
MASQHFERRKNISSTTDTTYSWTEDEGNNLVLVPGEEGNEKLKISVWDQGVISDGLIGQASLDLEYESLQEKNVVSTELDTGGVVELNIGWQHANPVYKSSSSKDVSAARPSMPSSVSAASIGGTKKKPTSLFNTVRS